MAPAVSRPANHHALRVLLLLPACLSACLPCCCYCCWRLVPGVTLTLQQGSMISSFAATRAPQPAVTLFRTPCRARQWQSAGPLAECIQTKPWSEHCLATGDLHLLGVVSSCEVGLTALNLVRITVQSHGKRDL